MARWIVASFAFPVLATVAACSPEATRDFCRDHYLEGRRAGWYATCAAARSADDRLHERLRDERICP
jgi:hypothetical protein